MFLLMSGTFPSLNDKQVPSYEMLGIPKYEEEAPPPPQPQHPLSPMGEACSRMDLTAIHQILVNTHYRDDEGSNEVKIRAFLLLSADFSTGYYYLRKMASLLQLSFQEWTQQMRDMLEARKRGDFAFRDKDFKAAIDCYTQVPHLSYIWNTQIFSKTARMQPIHFATSSYCSLLMWGLWYHQQCTQGGVCATSCVTNLMPPSATQCKHSACTQIGQLHSTCKLLRSQS